MNNFTVKPEFIIKIDKKDFITYHGLLDVGHQIGIKEINVDLVQIPTKDNEYIAICKAYVIAKNDDKFSDIGDANPNNCNRMIAKHIIRMSSTRAIARALRSMTNVGMACYEELDLTSDNKESDVSAEQGSSPIINKENNNNYKKQYKTTVKENTKKGNVSGLSAETRFNNALVIFNDRYSLNKKQLFKLLHKNLSDDIIEDDVYKIGQLWQDLEAKNITIEELLAGINDEK